MDKLKNFPHPLNTPITVEEEIEVTTPVFDPQSKKLTYQKRKEKFEVETTYHHVPREVASCDKFNHNFRATQVKKRYVATCNKCTRNIFLHPMKHTIKGGKIYNRDTNELLY